MPKPCNPDHNGECLVCDCWPESCAWNRLWNADYRYENKKELIKMLYKHMSKTEQLIYNIFYGKN